MWYRIKNIYTIIFRIIVVLFLGIFFFFLITTIMDKHLRGDSNVVNIIGLVALLISFPGMINDLADEINSKSKKYKVSCECPNCNHKIELEMKEE